MGKTSEQKPAVAGNPVDNLFEGAGSVPVEAWTGTDPETAGKLYGVTSEKIALKELVGREICIIGKMQRQGERGIYFVYLFVPRQETLALCTTATSSKSFIERVNRSGKLPVKGCVRKETGKKGDYYVLT